MLRVVLVLGLKIAEFQKVSWVDNQGIALQNWVEDLLDFWYWLSLRRKWCSRTNQMFV